MGLGLGLGMGSRDATTSSRTQPNKEAGYTQLHHFPAAQDVILTVDALTQSAPGFTAAQLTETL